MKVAVVLWLLLAACGDNLAAPPEPFCDAWHQWGSAPSHVGQSCVSGQPLQQVLADVELDSLVTAEIADNNGELVVHYQTPLVDGDSVYVEAKTGTYTPCVHQTDPTKECSDPADVYRYNTQIWSEVAYAWQDGVLAKQWTYISDWKPPLFEIVFHAALVDDFVAIPTAHGGIAEVDAQTGALRRLIAPFGDDPDSYVVSPLAVDRGNVYYTAVSLDRAQPYNAATKSWLVAVAPDGSSRTADFASLVVAPAAGDGCYGDFDPNTVPFPWPPPPNADGTPVLPKQSPCGPQIPGFSAAPGIAYDGTLYLASSALFNEAYSYLSSVNPGDLSTNWSASLRNRVNDACGVDVPYLSTIPSGYEGDVCRDGAPLGVDPNTGMPPAAFVDFSSTSSPVALPHGGVIYGALTYYNEERGHLLHFDDRGGFLGSYDFGWDLTPAVVSDASGDHIVVKDNHYGYGVDSTDPDPGPYWISLLDDRLLPIWQFQNTEHNSCVHAPDGSVTCTSDHPNGFEWCVNAPAVDRDGVVYVNSEDGNLYAISPNGELRDRLLLDRALGASYTPLSIDHIGRIFALNAGHLFVVGANQ